jgi:MFS family permease
MYSKNLVFGAACLGMLLFGIVFLSLGSANNMLAERFGLDDRAIGTLTALLPFGILIGSLVFGPVVDRFGYRWMLIAASLLVGASLHGMAIADSPRMAQLWVFFIGLGGGVLNGSTNALTADVSEGERGAKLSLLGVFFGIGAILMPIAIASLSHMFTMERIVSSVGALALVPVAFCLAIKFPPPKLRTERITVKRLFAMLGDPPLLFACLALAVQSGMEGMSNDWMTRFLKKGLFVDAADGERWAQLGLVALTGAMTVTRLGLAGVLHWVSSRTALLLSLMIAASGAMLMLTLSTFVAATIIGIITIGIGLAAGFPVVLGYVGDRYPQQSGTAFSTIFVVALLGNMAINKSFGLVAQVHGVRQYPIAMLGLLATSAVLLHIVVRLMGLAAADKGQRIQDR